MTDWPSALRLAAARFAIPPAAFWRLSVKEWAALTAPPRPYPHADALDRAALETLMTLYPDEARPMTTSRTVSAPKSTSTGGLSGFPGAAAEAAEALAGLTDPAQQAASAIDQAFAKAGSSLAQSMAAAATNSKSSLSDLARVAVSATESLAGGSMASVGSAAGSLGSALGSALGGVLSSVFGGARADGGPVSAGSAYLVGERGPEVFRPSASGEIGPAQTGGVTVNMTLSGASSPGAFVRSEAQVAQALARAARLGAR